MELDNETIKQISEIDDRIDNQTSPKYKSVGEALQGIGTTVAGMASGAVSATLGLPTDIIATGVGIKEAILADKGERMDAFGKGFTEVSKENMGSEYYKENFNQLLDSLIENPVLKQDSKSGFSAGEFGGVGGIIAKAPTIARGIITQKETARGILSSLGLSSKAMKNINVDNMSVDAAINLAKKLKVARAKLYGSDERGNIGNAAMAMTTKREPSPVREMTKLEQVISDVPKADADKLDDIDLYKFMKNFGSKYDDFDLALEQSKLPKEELNKAEIDFMDRMSNIDKIYRKRREKNLAKYEELDKHAGSADYKFAEAVDSAYDNAADSVDETAEEIFGRSMSKEELLSIKERGNLIFDKYFFSSLDSRLADMDLTEDYNFVRNLDEAMTTKSELSPVREIINIEAPPLEIGASKFALEGKLKSNLTSDSLDMFDDKAKGATAGSAQANNLIGVPVKDGEKVGIRKNLNSKSLDGEKGVLQTIHQNNYNGKALSYQPYATVENVTFNVNQSHRRRIASKAKGLAVPESSAKFNMASVDGNYVANKNLLRDGYETEIAFNPAQGHLFIDVNTGQAVKGAETATVVGDRVFANGVTYWKKSDAPKPLDASDGTKLTGEVRYKFRKGGLMARN